MRSLGIVLDEVLIEDGLHLLEGLEPGAAASTRKCSSRSVRCQRSIMPLSGMMISAPLVRCFLEEEGYGEPIWDTGRREHKGAGRPPTDPGLRARARYMPPLRLSRMRCERGSVGVVLPASSRLNRRERRVRGCGSLDWISTARVC
jgi:hypothetical protein